MQPQNKNRLKLIKRIFLLLILSVFVLNCEEESIDIIDNNDQGGVEKNDVLKEPLIVKDKKEESPVLISTDAHQILRLVNVSRSEVGLNSLTLNEALNKAAFKHSIDMKNQGKLSHTGSDGSSFSERAKRENYKGFPRGENVASGYRTAKDVHEAWMNSKGHRENILARGITEMGIGLSENFWTQIFGQK